MASFEPFVSSDPFSMSTFNSKLGGAFGKVDEAIGAAGNCKIATGSYVGTGNSSSNDPSVAVTLNIGFVPKIVFVYSTSFAGGANTNFCTIMMENLYSIIGYRNSMSFLSDSGNNTNIGKIVSWGSSVSFHAGDLAYFPNSSNTTYNWVALG